jgi:hypothetical protein
MALEGYPGQGRAGERKDESCPPHGPLLVEAVRAGSYVARCLACGLRGPVREDGVEAKRAFDEIIQ